MAISNKQPEKKPAPQSPEKKQTGDWGEQVAAEHLVAQGCGIIVRQWRSEAYEIDIIAQKGTRILFVEVKTRKDKCVDPVAAVNNRRRQHMINAADIFLKTLDRPFDYQFDIIAITGTPHDYQIEHIPDAFFPSPRTRH